MANEEFLVVADLDGSAQDSRIFLAAPITPAEIEELYADRIVGDETVRWGEREGAVLARKQRRLGALVLEDKPLAKPDAEKLKAAMLDGVRQLGLSALPWSDDLAKWRQRVAFLRRLDESWPDLSDAALLASLETWLAPFLDEISRRDHLARLDLDAALEGAGALGQAAHARPAGADPYRGAERLARAGRLCATRPSPPCRCACRRCSAFWTRRGLAAARCR